MCTYLSNMLGQKIKELDELDDTIHNNKNATNNRKRNRQYNNKQQYLVPPISDHNDVHETLVVCVDCYYDVMGINNYQKGRITSSINDLVGVDGLFEDVLDLAKDVIPSCARVDTPIAIATRSEWMRNWHV